jgi:hypothetical protein
MLLLFFQFLSGILPAIPSISIHLGISHDRSTFEFLILYGFFEFAMRERLLITSQLSFERLFKHIHTGSDVQRLVYGTTLHFLTTNVDIK